MTAKSQDTAIVKPRAIGGFPEWLPEEKLVEERFLRVIREEFERFGFSPIETPAVERQEVLTAKGIENKEIYALSRLAAAEGEDPATDLALHFDLTVPLARYVAQHFGKLTFPFRRYQMQKVWRGERPQAGRFREFYQCDIDIIGNGSLDPLNDAEIPAVIHAIFSRLEIGRFQIRLNNRKVLQGLLERDGVPAERFAEALRAIDALEKVGTARTVADLVAGTGLAEPAAEALVARLTDAVDLAALAALEGSDVLAEGVRDLTAVAQALEALGVPDEAWRIDLAIARGLDYYTGTVYETQLLDRPEIGSVCSGGRYDNLAGNYIRQHLPGVGISIGLSRLLARLFEVGTVVPGPATPAEVLVTVMDRAQLAYNLGLARDLRAAGLRTEVYSEPRKLGDQLKYAARKGFRCAVIAGDSEAGAGTAQLKDLAAGSQSVIARADLVATVRALLAEAPA